jgi:hypothetical protein
VGSAPQSRAVVRGLRLARRLLRRTPFLARGGTRCFVREPSGNLCCDHLPRLIAYGGAHHNRGDQEGRARAIMITPTFIRSGTSLNTRLPSYVACYRRRTNNSPIAEPLMSNASRAATGMSTERPPVLGRGSLSLGIVSRITSSLVEVVSPLGTDPVVLAPVVSVVVLPQSSILSFQSTWEDMICM